ncbi:cupin domain-containing protein [Sinanaerobacter sp. ZZT-01]|uniref:cupin domain-containing protein n=1 Tax=Sinanaerobacter sp. ZZT-01 TaxID=3111540 RepID=UPI002D77EAF7|nr:cupin domain-containing protein [Sinanaerobacter sp. ZZT-01]WRR92084.1 cupin domain-containing protein [Sinanaerobacter sp. ZZT-01]
MNVSEQLIQEIVQKVLTQSQGNIKNEFEKEADQSGILVVRTETVKTEAFEGRDDVKLKDIVTLEEAPRMGAGIMELFDGADFEWTLTYDEFDYVIDGTLEILIDGGRKITGKKGDIILIPKNSHISFSTPDYARYAYFVYPANWQELA